MDPPLDVHESLVPSPFDFQQQTVLAVPTDLPDAATGRDDLQNATADVLESVARLSGGGIFGLFTSHRALREVAERLRHRGVDARWPLFVQGEDERRRLLLRFVEHGHGVLLGTSSFWEGVDVPGDPLRGLVIQKLPFKVPTEPVTAARVEALEARGANAFYEYMLPLAALRLKQGFGRLIRTRTDRGAVVLLDDRIVRRRYGAYLLDSLPDTPLVKGPWRQIERHLAHFYE
jgi:ATP-dependent DNA helicase DinG